MYWVIQINEWIIVFKKNWSNIQLTILETKLFVFLLPHYNTRIKKRKEVTVGNRISALARESPFGLDRLKHRIRSHHMPRGPEGSDLAIEGHARWTQLSSFPATLERSSNDFCWPPPILPAGLTTGHETSPASLVDPHSACVNPRTPPPPHHPRVPYIPDPDCLDAMS